MGRKWLLPVCLIALLAIGGGLLWHAGVLHRMSNKDHLVALARLIGRDTLDKLDHTLSSARSKSAMFLLFLLPGLPKDVLSYAAGFFGMRILEFVVLSGLARSPALLATVLIGAGVSRRDYRSVLAIGLLVLLAIGGYYWYQRRNLGASASRPRVRG